MHLPQVAAVIAHSPHGGIRRINILRLEHEVPVDRHATSRGNERPSTSKRGVIAGVSSLLSCWLRLSSRSLSDDADIGISRGGRSSQDSAKGVLEKRPSMMRLRLLPSSSSLLLPLSAMILGSNPVCQASGSAPH